MKRIARWKLTAAIFIITLLFSLGWSLTKPSNAILAAHRYDTPSSTAIALVEPSVPVATESVEYVNIDGQAISGYYAYPEGVTESLPGILVIHEWWGLNENIEAMTRRLAGEGYRALAVDLYNGQVAETPEQASQLVQEVANNPFGAEANITKAYNYLSEEKQASIVASIGWCFGGSWSLETALLFPQELDAAVIYYGGEIGEATAEELSTLEMPILGIFGAEDSSIPLETVEEFESTLNELDKEAEIIVYQDAGHAFANPSGQNYVPEAAEAAWKETTEFLNEYLS
ncbi:dienelactone hydrolase family protein [Pleurocapsales cyanobacterium LEGE 10410]|nr:dienelactone hydrolase family protein [Pleurocapsales cyanobacterium LEGE 10410]